MQVAGGASTMSEDERAGVGAVSVMARNYRVNQKFHIGCAGLLSDTTDDHLAVRAGQDPALGGLGADTFVVRELSHVAIGDFHHSQHDRLAFDTGLGLHSLQDLANLVTDLRWNNDDLVLQLGAQASVTLVGARNSGIGLEDIDVLS